VCVCVWGGGALELSKMERRAECLEGDDPRKYNMSVEEGKDRGEMITIKSLE